VHNVLHERLFFQYEKEDERSKRTVKRVFERVSDHPAVDIVENTFDRPFYSTPSFDSNKRKTRPVSTIWYTAQGYGELLNPYSKSGVAIDNRPDALDMWDQPGGGAFFTLPDGAMLMRMEKVLGFQAWLVVKQALKIEVLAHIPAFSLMFWFETITKGFRPKNSFDTPPFKYGIYMEDGFVSSRKLDYKNEGIGSVSKMRAVAGKGARNPVVTGPAASEGALQWLAANNLHL
jgi:hypothetical protein